VVTVNRGQVRPSESENGRVCVCVPNQRRKPDRAGHIRRDQMLKARHDEILLGRTKQGIVRCRRM